ncbi:MAG: hypothetical protein ABFR19_02355 [Pseudomonadota bacterium]
MMIRLLLVSLPLVLAACVTTGGRDPASNMIRHANDSPAEAHVRIAKGYLEQGQMAFALDKAQEAVRIDRNHIEAQVVLALIYQRMNNAQLAAKHYTRAKKLAPNDPLVANAYGTFLCTQRRYAEAGAEFDQAATSVMNTSPWVASTNAGLCLEKHGRYTEAAARMRQALQQNPDYIPAQKGLKRLGKL